MTTATKYKIWQKLGEAGLIFVLMAVVIYVLYGRMESTENRMFELQKRTNDRLHKVEEEVRNCRDENMEILLKSNQDYIEVIKKNNEYLKNNR